MATGSKLNPRGGSQQMKPDQKGGVAVGPTGGKLGKGTPPGGVMKGGSAGPGTKGRSAK